MFEIFKRYTGKLFDEDDDLMDTVFAGYHVDIGEINTEVSFSFFSGKWVGFYQYGEGYRDTSKGKKVNFVMTLHVNNGVIKGTRADENKQSDGPASIDGFIFDNFISFVHQYPFKYFLDETGEMQKDVSNPPSKIDYTGLYDATNNSFKGIWHIKDTKFWGEWTMEREIK